MDRTLLPLPRPVASSPMLLLPVLLLMLLLMPIVLSSCATTANSDKRADPADLARFLGQELDQATDVLGTPSAVYNMQDGTWHVLWTEDTGHREGAKISWAGIEVVKGDPVECTRVLVVNRQRLIIDYKYEGDC